MKQAELYAKPSKISNLTNINIIMGRNGSGKSRFLRNFDEELSASGQYNIRYVSPERAGVFEKDGSVITNMEQSPDWLRRTRAVNQASNFKAASAALLRDIETIYLRKLSETVAIRGDFDRNFKNDRLDRINRLLTNIYLDQDKSDFKFRNLEGTTISPKQISSGESEAASLATEIIYFFDTLEPEKFNILF